MYLSALVCLCHFFTYWLKMGRPLIPIRFLPARFMKSIFFYISVLAVVFDWYSAVAVIDSNNTFPHLRGTLPLNSVEIIRTSIVGDILFKNSSNRAFQCVRAILSYMKMYCKFINWNHILLNIHAPFILLKFYGKWKIFVKWTFSNQMFL